MPQAESPYSKVIVPAICKAIYGHKMDKTETHEVEVYDSPIGEFMGPIYCSAIHSPGMYDNYRKGDKIQVIMNFVFADGRFIDKAPGSAHYILGKFVDRSIANIKVKNPLTEDDNDRIAFIHEKSGAGLVVTENGQLIVATNGPLYTVMRPFGFGVEENCHQTYAQNHHRIISMNGPMYLSKELFGMYSGRDQEEKSNHLSPTEILINYRRFVTQTQDITNWVSTCEGAFAPFVGANNSFNEVSKSRETLYSKVINHNDNRLTIESGEPGSEFFKLRIDKVIVGEGQLSVSPGARPAQVGNRFKMSISDNGIIDIYAGGDAAPSAPSHKLHIQLTENGDLKIYSSGSITLSHGQSDEGVNAIKLDPAAGIDITAKKGFRVNGQEVLVKAFLDWFDKYKTTLCQVTSIGGPAPIHPAALPEFITGTLSPESASGFLSKEIGINAQGIIKDPDQHISV
jgi:hypothetical protein